MSNVLVLSGFDPSAGAGILRDTLAINSLGAHPFGIITVNTAQNTQEVTTLLPLPSTLIAEQFRLLSNDVTFDAVKIGLVAAENADSILHIVQDLALPVVLDPILLSSTNATIGNKETILSLVPYTYLLTPNLFELQELSGKTDITEAVHTLQVPYILVTSARENENSLTHQLYHQGTLIKEFHYAKLPFEYHGSGCTLSAMLSVSIGGDIIECCQNALDATYQALQQAIPLGKVQQHPQL